MELLISVAPNGARKSKKEFPNLPITPQELAFEAQACYQAGARLFHLHVRDDKGGHSLDPDRYREAIKEVKNTVPSDMIIQATTEAVGKYTSAEQMAVVRDLKPEAVSMGIRELVPDDAGKAAAKPFFEWVFQQPMHVQFICYSPKDLEWLDHLCQEGVVPFQSRYFILFVLGDKTGRAGTPAELYPFLEAKNKLRIAFDWAVCAFGEKELDCMLEAVKNGGHVRIGFENNHLMADGTRAPNNAALIKQFANALSKTYNNIAK